MTDDSISSSDRAEYWLEGTRFLSALLCLSGTFGLGGTWGLLEGAERLGCKNPLMSTRTPSTLTLVGEHLEGDESSFKVAVFKGPAEPLGALLEGAAEPLHAILCSNLAMLVSMSKLVAVEATHRVRNKQGHLHL